MTTTVPILTPLFKAFDNNGQPLAGGLLYSYAAGTSTPQATYPASNETTPNPNPVVLNARGEALVWLDPTSSYKFNLTDANGNQIPGWPIDNISGPINLSSNLVPSTTNTYTLGTPSISWANLYLGPSVAPVYNSSSNTVGYTGQTAAESYAGVTPTNYFYSPGTAFRYGVDPTGANDSTVTMQNWINAAWAMYQYTDAQGLWNGGGGAVPILDLPPGKYKVSGTIYLPVGITLRGRGHPANTISHTRIIMNSTGVNPPASWAANTAYNIGDILQPLSPNGYWYQCTTAGTSGSGAPSWGTSQGGTTTDNTAIWTCGGTTAAGDNRNIPMFKWRRGSLPSYGGGSLVDQGVDSAIENLEFWFVTLGSTFSSPLSGSSWTQRSYPKGAAIGWDVDCTDTRILNCCFQNTPCALWGSGINTVSATRGDGFAGSWGILNLFIENCEFDAAPAHCWFSGCNLGLIFKGCHFYGSPQYFYGNNNNGSAGGNIDYQYCFFQAGCSIDAYGYSGGSGYGASPAANNLARFSMVGCVLEPGAPIVTLNKATTVNISNNTMLYATTIGGIVIIDALGGSISGNAIDSQGANAPAGSTLANFAAAIKALGCQNLRICDNTISASYSATYNGFGILTGNSADQTSQYNFVSGNAITAPYNGATFNGQSRFLNLASADLRGVNFNYHTSTTQAEIGTALGLGPTNGPTDMTPDAGTFTGTGTGFSGTAPTFACSWAKNGKIVTLTIGANTGGTSNSTSFGMSGLPTEIQPTSLTQWVRLVTYFTNNNGAGLTGSSEVVVEIQPSGSLGFVLNGSLAGWANSSTKGFNVAQTFSYAIL